MPLDPTPLVGTRSGPILIMGSARCLWDDLKALGDWPHERMCLNVTGLLWRGEFRHWATLHPDVAWFHPSSPFWRFNRQNHVRPIWLHGSSYNAISIAKLGPNAAHVYEWPFERRLRNGSTGLFGVEVALALGHDPVVLAGVPLDGSGYFWEPAEMPIWLGGFAQQDIHATWAERAALWGGRVKSLSGYTRQLLGGPEGVALPPLVDLPEAKNYVIKPADWDNRLPPTDPSREVPAEKLAALGL